MTEPITYIGKDLEAMSFTVNYQNWIIEQFQPFIGKHVVEVGAGTGSISALLLDEKPETLALVEPSEMFAQLEKNIAAIETATEVTFHNSLFLTAGAEIAKNRRPDTIVYVNVLEHVEEDQKELEMIYDCLETGGHALIFVPALMALYGHFDRNIGHFRRYSKKELEDKCRSAGFEIVMSKYFDLAGIAPWFIKYKIFRSGSLSVGAVKVYDKLVIPVAKRLEALIPVPLGKNVVMVVRKTP